MTLDRHRLRRYVALGGRPRWLLVLVVLALAAPPPAMAATPRHVAADARIEHYALPTDQVARAAELAHDMRVAYFARALGGLIILVVLLRSGAAGRIARWVERRTSRPWLRTCLGAAMVLMTVAGAELPLELALGGRVEALAWAARAAFVVGAGTVVAAALYAVIRRWPRGWWWRAWLFALPLVVVAPIATTEVQRATSRGRLVDRDPTLVERVEVLARRRGVALDRGRIFVVASLLPDAQAAGVGPWRAIFVNEGALAELDDRELAFLLAHELGHFEGPAFEVVTLAALALVLGGVLAALAAFVGLAIRWHGERWQVPAVSSVASLPVGLLAIALLGLVLTPIRAVVQRHIERRADAAGLEVLAAVDPDARQAAAHMLQRAGEVLRLPARDGVLDVLCGVEHPAIGDRIDFVLAARSTER